MPWHPIERFRLATIALRGSRIVLVTAHRRESFGAGFEAICRAIAELAARFPETHFIYPVHLNPNVREPVYRILREHAGGAGGKSKAGNIHLIEPVPYLDFVVLMGRASLILTDSGGIQEEAPSLGTPVLVMREATERPEALGSGLVRLVGTDRERIVSETAKLLESEGIDRDVPDIQFARRHPNPYGDGKAAERIVAAHCHGDAAVNACIDAGIDCIEHGSLATDETLDLMVERGTFLVATSYLADGMDVSNADPELQAKAAEVFPRSRETISKAIKKGVKVACGTDAPAIPHGRNAKELISLVNRGMTPIQAIRAALYGNAHALRVPSPRPTWTMTSGSPSWPLGAGASSPATRRFSAGPPRSTQ